MSDIQEKIERRMGELEVHLAAFRAGTVRVYLDWQLGPMTDLPGFISLGDLLAMQPEDEWTMRILEKRQEAETLLQSLIARARG